MCENCSCSSTTDTMSILYSLFEFCHSLLVALCAFVSCKVAAGRSQTTCTFNHSILVRTSFCFVVLVVLFHTINDFGFMAIIVLLPGCRRHLPAQCGTEFFDVLAFGCVEFSFVFCLHFPLALLSTRENKSDFDISARFGFVLAGFDRNAKSHSLSAHTQLVSTQSASQC